MRNWMMCLGLAGTLSACGIEAGYQVDSGTFGNATLNNTQMMNGERSYTQVLADRFAREIPTQINFAFDSAELDATAQQVLTLQADWIRQFPEVRFRVYGHTDAVGSSGYNKSLGMRRARAVVSFFASRGISRSRLEAVVSYGETQPLVPTGERERRNRRTVTQVSGFVDGNQNLLDGKYAQVVYREYIKSAEPKTTVEIDTSSSAFEQ
ncbi:OmpA family protein [Ruegeria pomeroyi]|jgi:outer membrane protein OmpA-like peptidoglycan-associated protein|nr:OmpA family protein [Ruegeria pomeroyi]NVK96677.1 OmpA family protein [Ruegeria pomeroyi]NVL03651.1 OmpA family protein [Ruegeria pomeroyi]QWV09872.1 OmpA family protein [Ruegeria pomeroyi]HCE72321.1 OmpA family protein [Ruegeria sp.]